MNCIIIADKTSAKLLKEYVARCPSLNLAGTYNDSASAMDQLSGQLNIDLTIIDIELTGIKCIELVDNLKYPPYIIVVSSTSQYAMKAFDFNVVDYLLKSVSYFRFCRAVEKTIGLNAKRSTSPNENQEVFIKQESSLVKLKIKDIIFIEALENYVTLTTRNKKFTIHFTMKAIEKELPSEFFVRVHRSFIVNRRMIKAIYENSLDLIVGDTLKNLPIGKSFQFLLMSELNLIGRKNLLFKSA